MASRRKFMQVYVLLGKSSNFDSAGEAPLAASSAIDALQSINSNKTGCFQLSSRNIEKAVS